MKKKVNRRFTAALLSLLVCLLCLPRTALAYREPSREELAGRKFSLTLQYVLPDVRFRIYRVAELTEKVQFHVLDSYKDYNIQFQAENNSDWLNLARTVYGYVSNGSMEPEAVGWTDADGKVVFSARTDARGNKLEEGLEQGLYLVAGDRITVERERMVYTPTAFFVCLPGWEPDGSAGDGSWLPDVMASVKYEKDPIGTVDRRVLKVWDDSGYETQRPQSVTVELRRNGETWDTVTLSPGNWGFTWRDLDNRYDWQVVEVSGNEGYRVSTRLEGITVVVTNSIGGWNPPPKDPDDPQEPNKPPEDPGNPDDPTDYPPDNPTDYPPDDPSDYPPDISDTPNEPDLPPPPTDEWPDDPEEFDIPDFDVPQSDLPSFEEDIDDPDVPKGGGPEEFDIDDPDVPLDRLPQTGQLWWPVPVLAVGGMFLFMLGWIRNRRSEADED